MDLLWTIELIQCCEREVRCSYGCAAMEWEVALVWNCGAGRPANIPVLGKVRFFKVNALGMA